MKRGPKSPGRGMSRERSSNSSRAWRRPIRTPRPSSNRENDFQLLVAVVLSALATDVGVNKATRRLFAEVRTPEQMVALGEEGLKQHIRTIGLST